MKVNIRKHKLNLASLSEKNIPLLLNQYMANDFEALGKISYHLITLLEYYKSNIKTVKFKTKFIEYTKGRFVKDYVLVLRDTKNVYGYSANYIIKFFRGESVHGASDLQDKKRIMLYKFIFEEDISIQWLFQYGLRFIVGCNQNGMITTHQDSKSRIIQEYSVDGKEKQRVSIVESIFLTISYEFWSSYNYDASVALNPTNRIFFNFKPLEYKDLLTEQIAEKLNIQLDVMQKNWSDK